MGDLVSEFADEYRRRLEELRQAYRREGYCGFPWRLIEGLSLGEACRLAPLLCEIGATPGDAPWEDLSGVRVADLTSDPWFQALRCRASRRSLCPRRRSGFGPEVRRRP